MTTAEYIKKLRLSLCMSQREFSELCGVHISTICYYESGERKPSFPTIRKIMTLAKKHGIHVKLEDIRADYAETGKARD
jgi:transcriptional regulator with XRE-family HTH domain